MIKGLLIVLMLAGTVQGVELTDTEKFMLDNVNKSRVAAGLPALVIDKDLQIATRQHACWMATNRVMRHAPGWMENIAMGQRTCASVHTTWMNSSGHRAAILRRGVQTVGVSAYVTAGGTIYWCLRVR